MTQRPRWPLRGWSVDRVLLAAGAVMLPAGMAAILLGWYGAARTGLVFEQIPYLISGGLLGLGLMAAGGLLYLASWISRLAEQQRGEMTELRELLADLRKPTPPTSASGPRGAVPLVVTATGTMVHRPDCAVVAGKAGLRPVTDADNGLRPCKLCAPPHDPEPPAP